MKKYGVLLFCMTLSLLAMSQKAVISFEKTSHDFGKVNEEDGKITYVFELKNVGSTPLVINRVQASCGCTTPIWTKEPIEPGKKGAITVTYNPQGRPGPFTKTITVYSNAADEQMLLTIKGEVISKDGGNNGSFPINMGGAGLKSKIVQMNNVEFGRVQTRVIDVQNTTNASMRLSVEDLPQYLTVSVSPQVLKPNEGGKITFTFNTKYNSQWGPISDDVFLSVNGQKKLTDDYKLTVVANMVEDFSKMTLADRRKAPIFETPNRTIDLGVLKAGSKSKAKFVINNKGMNSLEIRRIINNNKELFVGSPKLSIGSSKSEKLVVALNTKNLTEGDYKRTITLQTNDPDNSYVILTLAWRVK